MRRRLISVASFVVLFILVSVYFSSTGKQLADNSNIMRTYYPSVTDTGKVAFIVDDMAVIYGLKNRQTTIFTPPLNCRYDNLSWSPSASYIVASLICPSSQNSMLEIMDTANHTVRILFTGMENNYAIFDSPAWSPDGAKIAFLTKDQNGSHQIWLIGVNPDGIPIGQPQAITKPGNYKWLTWMSGNLVFSIINPINGTTDLYVLYPVTMQTRILVESNDMDEQESAISPDGTMIAYSASTAGNTQIFIKNLIDQSVFRVTFGTDDDHPNWSPDGSYLMFQRNLGTQKSLYYWNKSTGATAFFGMGASPAWAPN